MAAYFELNDDEARDIVGAVGAGGAVGAVGAAVATWRDEAAGVGLTPAEVERMASAFEHEDLERARQP